MSIRVAILVLVAVAFVSTSATATPPEDAPLLGVSTVDVSDARDGADDGDDPRMPPLWLAVRGALGLGSERTEAAMMVMLGTSLEHVAKPRAIRLAAAEIAQPGDDDTALQEPTTRTTPRLDGALARGAVDAALAAQSSRHHDLDDLATRARVSGLLPELRVRVAHVIDEDQTLSPTEYDPGRVTASGGTSVWLEGRATFRLDRLVFADDEVAVERLVADREKARRALVEDVLRSLATWEEAEAALGDPAIEDLKRVEAEVKSAVAESTLDVLTDGWFSREVARRRKAAAVPSARAQRMVSDRMTRAEPVPTVPSGSLSSTVTSSSSPRTDSIGKPSESSRKRSPKILQ